MISCRARLVTMDETWLYHYDLETNQQSMEWRHSGSPCPPKIPSAKLSLEKFSPPFLGTKTASSASIIFQKGQAINAEYYWSLLVQLKDILKEKRRGAGRSRRVSCSCTTMPRLTGHLQPRRNWPIWASNVLITHPILRIWPVGLPPVPWTERTIER